MKFIEKIKKNYFEKNQTLLVILFLAFIIRMFFVYKDLPFIFHPDEPTIVNSTINLRYNLNPKHFDWPTGYYYINYFFYGVLEKTEIFLNLLKIPHSYLPTTENYYILSRIVTVIFGVLSILFTYLILNNIFKDRSISIFGAVVLSLIPLHVSRSAMVLNDVPLVFFSTLSIYYLTKNLIKEENKYFYLAAFFSGMAVSMKYNAYLIFVTLALFIFMVSGFRLADFKRYILMVFAGAFGFFLGTPYAVFDYKTFLRDDGPAGALWQFKNVGSVDSLWAQFIYFFQNLFINNLEDTGYIPLLASIFVGVFIVYRFFKTKNLDTVSKLGIIFFVQVLYIVWVVSGLKIQRSHYFILMYSFLPILSAYLIFYFPKIKNFFLILFLILAINPLFKNLENDPLSNFYNSIKLEPGPKDYNFVYDSSRMKPVLQKLRVNSDKKDFDKIDNHLKYTHALSNSDLCSSAISCKFELKFKYQNFFNKKELYIYEIKR